MWASSPHLRSKFNFAICFSCCNCILWNLPIRNWLSLWNKLQIRTRQRGNCCTLVGKSMARGFRCLRAAIRATRPEPRQHFWKIAGSKNFLFLCSAQMTQPIFHPANSLYIWQAFYCFMWNIALGETNCVRFGKIASLSACVLFAGGCVVRIDYESFLDYCFQEISLLPEWQTAFTYFF